MKGEHADLLELSTLRRALRSVVEEIPRDKLGQRGAMETTDFKNLGCFRVIEGKQIALCTAIKSLK